MRVLTVSARDAVALVSLLIVGGASFALFAGKRHASREPVLAPARVADGPSLAPATDGGQRCEHPLDTPARARTESVGDVLSRYWGARWPDMRAAVESEGVDLEAAFELAPWEEAQEEIRSEFVSVTHEQQVGISETHVGWPGELTVDWLRERYSVPRAFEERHLDELQYTTSELNGRLALMAEDYVEQVRFALEDLWARDAFVRAPRSLAGTASSHRSKPFFYRTMASGTGWCVAGGVSEEEFPYIALLRDEMKKLRGERDAVVRGFLRSL